MYWNRETLTTLGSSGTKLLLASWLVGFQNEAKETQFLLCWLFHLTPPRAAHLVDSTGLASPRLKKQLASPRSESQLTAFFKIHPKFSAYHFRAWRHSHPQSISIRVFIMTSVIVTSSPREREYLRSMCAPTRALSRIVLSRKIRYNQRKMII